MAVRKPTTWSQPKGTYLARRSLSRSAVDRGPAVEVLRQALGLIPRGVYDGVVREAVLEAQEKAGLPQTGVVEKADWDAIVKPRRKR